MAAYTPDYQLHQRAGSGKFLRTDFNQDFKPSAVIVEQADGNRRTGTRTVLGGMAVRGYPLYYYPDVIKALETCSNGFIAYEESLRVNMNQNKQTYRYIAFK
ncbi:hypothetical protein D1159_15455 [Pseudoflavonifractor sp. 524-17]|uniref:hypothetical protein n=1 Tax=Pseudoflavonifractor sp. 524-17 TaxID=2304577 RepID=UPI00137B35CB|nr:hypothetical protein [Pseudoflavonifractor sp. 524-17]NCE65936.1 hypothetical protein [Pseudoflavonifractor sp. 524-17]